MHFNNPLFLGLLGLVTAMDLPTVTNDLSVMATDLLNLNRVINAYSSTGEQNSVVTINERRLEEHTTAAIEHIRLLDPLDPYNSKTITDIILQLGPSMNRYLSDVQDKKSYFKEAHYDQTMRQNLERFQKEAKGLSETVQTKVQPNNARQIKETFQESDQWFDRVIKQFQ
ncbi:hydrophobic surface binding protein A-domain-containing protein [Aspergillus ambiguus]|uniref:cell wall mannoprotein 1 family protein n=1 Tax=Aspergillus ambiguus TaxID=176160 RepID=UPI003CCD93EA